MQYPKRYGRRRSFVRFISCILPLRPAPRIFFHTVKNPSCAFEGVDICHNRETPHPSKNKDFTSHFARSGFSTKPDLLDFESETDHSEGVVTQKLDNLEKELQELRQQMARIMATQLKPDLMPENANVTSTPLPSQMSVPQPPPPPPPLPPPMPAFNNTPRIVISRSEKPIHTSTPKRPGGAIDMANILKDLGKVKLRHVARSPGGTPLRLPPPPTDPNTMLLVALKKRYAVMHDRTPEKISNNLDRCSESDSSFTEENSCRTPLIKC